MKPIYLYSTPSGPINLIKGDDMPPKPELCVTITEGDATIGALNCSLLGCQCEVKQEAYNKALQAAKESSVPIQDQVKFLKAVGLTGDLQPDTIYGPFTVEYRKEITCNRDCPGSCFHPSNCDTKTRTEIAILYDDTPEKERPGLRDALREVKANNKELRDSYNDPTRLDFRIKDSRGFPTGEVVDEAKVTPDKEPQEDQETLWREVDRIFNVKWTFGMPDDVMQELKEKFTITRKS